MTAPLTKSIFQKQESKICIEFLQAVQRNHTLENDLMRWANVNKKDQFGFTPLYWAITHHNMYNVKLLLAYGATLEVTCTMNAVFYAIDCDNLEALKYFIERGIDKNITRTNDTGKEYTLAEYAKGLKRKVILEYLN